MNKTLFEDRHIIDTYLWMCRVFKGDQQIERHEFECSTVDEIRFGPTAYHEFVAWWKEKYNA